MNAVLLMAVLLGGAIGAIARASVGRLLPSSFPIATLLVNISGSFLLAAAAVAIPPDRLLAHATIGAGFAGAFTTFSTFLLETILLHRTGQTIRAFFYLTATVLLCCLASLAAITIFSSHASSV